MVFYAGFQEKPNGCDHHLGLRGEFIMNTNLVTVDKAAEVLGISASFVYKLVRTKRLVGVKIGTSVRIRLHDLDEFISQNLTSNDVVYWIGPKKSVE